MLGSAPKDKVHYPPTIIGQRGRAWLCDLDEVRRKLDKPAASDGTLANWVIEARWAHPAWHSYALTLVHLRPTIPLSKRRSTSRAQRTRSGYTPWTPTRGSKHSFARWWLTPKNFASQFIETDDAAALARVRSAVVKICEGHLSPDTDYIRHWMHLFGDCMVKDKANAGRTRVVLDLGGPNETTLLDIPPRPGPQDRH